MIRTTICLLIVLLAGSGPCGSFLFAQHPGFQGPGYPGAPLKCYFQPVQFSGPEGIQVALAAHNRFVERDAAPLTVGLLLGADYRVRITDIPLHPGKEVFPSVQIIARTFPPRGKEIEFPIPIKFSQEDLELALDGKYVTRVVYLEDPNNALPVRGDVGLPITQINHGNPIDVAKKLGQPVAIVRIGGRVPNFAGGDMSFFLGCPAWQAFNRANIPNNMANIHVGNPVQPTRPAPPQFTTEQLQAQAAMYPGQQSGQQSGQHPGQSPFPALPQTLHAQPAENQQPIKAAARMEYAEGNGWYIPDNENGRIEPLFRQPVRYTY